MKKKGFTLVELLAVIAILAILVIMALPAVLRMYRQSRINNFQNETRSTYRTAQSQFLSDSMLLESGQKILYTNGCSTSSNADVVKTLDMTGNSNFKYYVLIDVDGKVLDVKTSNGTYSYLKHGSDLKIEELNVEDGNGATLDSDISDTICTATGSSSGNSGAQTRCAILTFVWQHNENQLSPGDEVQIAGENFHVISTNSTKTVLITTEALESNNSQVEPYGYPNLQLSFSENGYWDGSNIGMPQGLISPYNSNGASYGVITNPDSYCSNHNDSFCYGNENKYPYVYDSNSSLYPYVSAYANKIANATNIDITGRLLTFEEAISSNNDLIRDNNGGYYWLGSAVNEQKVWIVDVDGYIYAALSDSYPYHIRPVLEVSTLDIYNPSTDIICDGN